MISPEIPSQRLVHYGAKLEDGRTTGLTIYRAELPEGQEYTAYTDSEVSAGDGTFTLKSEPSGDLELADVRLPEKHLADRYLRERTLAALAFEALTANPRSDDTYLRMDSGLIDESSHSAYRSTLGVRLRRTGHLNGGREMSVTAHVTRDRALGRVGEMLRLAQASREAPIPHVIETIQR